MRADEVSMNFRNICFMFLLYATICIVRGDNIVEQLLQRVSKLENDNAKMAKIKNEWTKNMAKIENDVAKNIAKIESDVAKNIAIMKSDATKNMAKIENDVTKNMAKIENVVTKNMAKIENDATKNMAKIENDMTKLQELSKMGILRSCAEYSKHGLSK